MLTSRKVILPLLCISVFFSVARSCHFLFPSCKYSEYGKIEVYKECYENTLLSIKRTHGNNTYPSSGIVSMVGLVFFSGGSCGGSSMDTLREEDVWPL